MIASRSRVSSGSTRPHTSAAYGVAISSKRAMTGPELVPASNPQTGLGG
jgi:hypothetical protein